MTSHQALAGVVFRAHVSHSLGGSVDGHYTASQLMEKLADAGESWHLEELCSSDWLCELERQIRIPVYNEDGGTSYVEAIEAASKKLRHLAESLGTEEGNVYFTYPPHAKSQLTSGPTELSSLMNFGGWMSENDQEEAYAHVAFRELIARAWDSEAEAAKKPQAASATGTQSGWSDRKA